MSPRSKPTRLPVEQIAVGQRYRRDLGDLQSLAASIEEVGLLHPIVVTPQGRLIAGQRRLKACLLLGWAEVPVNVVDLLQAARGEAHENFVRKDLLPSEIVVLKRAIEPLERRGARQRQETKTDLCHPATVAEGQGDARDKIARYLGVGRTTIERAEAVVEAAEEEPDEYGYLVEQMDRSGKVAGAYRRLTVLKQAKELDAAPPELPTGPFQAVVADPPWQYDTGSSLPYPTMPVHEIKALCLCAIPPKPVSPPRALRSNSPCIRIIAMVWYALACPAPKERKTRCRQPRPLRPSAVFTSQDRLVTLSHIGSRPLFAANSLCLNQVTPYASIAAPQRGAAD